MGRLASLKKEIDWSLEMIESDYRPVKRTGKIRISHIPVPLAPWTEAIPRSATSDEVSKPRPNITPRGYIFHGLLVVRQVYGRNLRFLPVYEFEHLLEQIEETSSSVDLESCFL